MHQQMLYKTKGKVVYKMIKMYTVAVFSFLILNKTYQTVWLQESCPTKSLKISLDKSEI